MVLALTLWNFVTFNKTKSDVSPPSASSSIFDSAGRIRPPALAGAEAGAAFDVGTRTFHVSILHPGRCPRRWRMSRGQEAHHAGAQTTDDILPRYEKARRWRRIKVILCRFFGYSRSVEDLLAPGYAEESRARPLVAIGRILIALVEIIHL
jgi:hypothetical protein